MSITKPVHIKHIYLEKQWKELSDMLSEKESCYYIFWWRDVPLAEWFTSDSRDPKKELYEELADKLFPAINFYIKDQKRIDTCKKYFLQKDISSLTKILDEYLPYTLPNSFPHKVDVSVIICTRNRSADLKKCLEVLMAQSCLPKEIIVVDNAPSDGATQKVVADFENIIYCKEPRPGLSIARNTGIRLAKQSIIAWIDDDVLVHPLWTYRIWQTFQTEDAGAITGLVIASSLNTKGQQQFEKYWSFNVGYIDKVYDQKYFKELHKMAPPVWKIGAGANMAFRRSVFDEVGFFNELLGAGASGCSEDSEMWYRLLVKGITIYYCARAVVFHEHRHDVKLLNAQIFNYMKGHVTALLLQNKNNKYTKYLYRTLPKYYLSLLLNGFPAYSLRYKTLWNELRGLAAGIHFYRKNKKMLHAQCVPENNLTIYSEQSL